jgi:hypothetical protein
VRAAAALMRCINPLEPDERMNNKHSVRTSQETHHVSATKTNRLLLFREIIVVYRENHMEHINTLCGLNVETLYIRIQFVPHRKHYVPTTETNRLMLFGEIIAIYCENHTEHVNTLRGQKAETLYIRIQFVPHRKHITSPLQRRTS